MNGDRLLFLAKHLLLCLALCLFCAVSRQVWLLIADAREMLRINQEQADGIFKETRAGLVLPFTRIFS